jgi:hypothetical protein
MTNVAKLAKLNDDLKTLTAELVAAGYPKGWEDKIGALSTQINAQKRLAGKEVIESGKGQILELCNELRDKYGESLMDFFIRAEEIVGEQAQLLIRFDRSFTNDVPIVGLAKFTNKQVKTVDEAHESKAHTSYPVNSKAYLALVGDETFTAEMCIRKDCKPFIGMTFNEATLLHDEMKKNGEIGEKDGNPKYNLGQAMATLIMEKYGELPG